MSSGVVLMAIAHMSRGDLSRSHCASFHFQLGTLTRLTSMSEPLIDPALLANLSEEEQKQALAAAEAAKRAEERAEKRALERALKAKEEQRRREKQQLLSSQTNGGSRTELSSASSKVQFVSKKQRMELKNQQLNEKSTTSKPTLNGDRKRNISSTPQSVSRTSHHRPPTQQQQQQPSHSLSQAEVEAIKKSYLGKTAPSEQDHSQIVEQGRKKRAKKKIKFKFQWDNTDDTSHLDDSNDFLYSALPSRKKRPQKSKVKDIISTFDTVTTKPILKMTARDWRIFRENYDISVKGGRAPPPLRSFGEASDPSLPKIHPSLLDAIDNVLKFKEPSPIQRQAIPIGLQRRDLLGIAETGSGKTVAFGVPLCTYLLNLPQRILDRVADDGPLALVMAPTRELAIQIDVEFGKLLSCQSNVSTFAVVGGQPIQQQAMRLRQGVHIVVGTPGRINDCVEMAYLVLNQCCYIVMDEADRMIDLGFAPQMEQILDAMGGLLKSEDESLTYRQEMEDLKNIKDELPRHRLTAMFSATMPGEVERLARKYLRHPAMVTIGDQDSGKNARITQRVIFLSSPSQKEKALREQLLNPGPHNNKVIVFVNEKKFTDGVGRMVERMGRRCVVLHGGKSQDQREENLDAFRRGGVVLVATDVAGRGLDIPDVTHVINYDVPQRSIDNYCHRIGRTGRAGKQGLATSFITDEDEGIMAPLKAYLESTGMQIPDRLARHPAANSASTQQLG